METFLYALALIAASLVVRLRRSKGVERQQVLINRTLVYVTLAVMLAVVYFGGMAAIQATFRTLSSQRSELAAI